MTCCGNIERKGTFMATRKNTKSTKAITDDEIPSIGHNGAPEDDIDVKKVAAFKDIDDLLEETSNWADGEPITSETMHDEITKLVGMLKDAGDRADCIRVELKRPHDVAAKAVQDEFNPYVQKDKGKVDKAKRVLNELLTAWRVKVAREQEAIAQRLRDEASAAREEANKAIQNSRGNLIEREYAEDDLKRAKEDEAAANRAARDAGKGLGLRTVLSSVVLDKDAGVGMDWAFDFAPEKFYELAERLAYDHVRTNQLERLDGFVITREKVARG
jgi:hypothetical protein